MARARAAPVERATVEELGLEPASLDAAIAWHVLEHLDDPAAAVARIGTWLRPGGRVVLACPNLASLQARIGGDRWFHQDVPRHRTHFTAAGLRLLLERSGFRLERMSPPARRAESARDVADAAQPADPREGRRLPGAEARPWPRARSWARPGVAAVAGPLLVPVAVALELAAGLAGRGGSVVAVAPAGTRPGPGEPRHRHRPDRGRRPPAHEDAGVARRSPRRGGGLGRRQRLRGPGVASLGSRIAGVEVIRLERNIGYTRGVNLAARKAGGDALVLLNDDCVCDPGYVEAVVAPLDPAAGVTMAAGVMREARDPARIDTRGDAARPNAARLRLPERRAGGVPGTRRPDPIGPSGAAAAFDREAFLAAGGFDEKLFAYWEDVDLVLRMRLEGARCALARDATRRPPPLGHAGLGLAAQELPDGLRPRLHAAQVGRALEPAAAGEGARRRRRHLPGPGGHRPERRRHPRPHRGLAGGDPGRRLSRRGPGRRAHSAGGPQHAPSPPSPPASPPRSTAGTAGRIARRSRSAGWRVITSAR